MVEEQARNRQWAERRANRLNAKRLAELPLFANTHALEVVAPTITTDQMVEWETNRVEASNRHEAEQRRYWEDRYWEMMADCADCLPEYERQIMLETWEQRYQLDPTSPNYTSRLASHCDVMNTALRAAEAPGYHEHLAPESLAYSKSLRAGSIATFFFCAAMKANRENGHPGPSFKVAKKEAK